MNLFQKLGRLFGYAGESMEIRRLLAENQILHAEVECYASAADRAKDQLALYRKNAGRYHTIMGMPNETLLRFYYLRPDRREGFIDALRGKP